MIKESKDDTEVIFKALSMTHTISNRPLARKPFPDEDKCIVVKTSDFLHVSVNNQLATFYSINLDIYVLYAHYSHASRYVSMQCIRKLLTSFQCFLLCNKYYTMYMPYREP